MARCLVLGARGYIGSLLVPALAAAGHSVLAMSRSLPPGPGAVRGDVRDPAALAAAMSGVEVVFHLVHSMDVAGYAEQDEAIAVAVARAAEAEGVRQIVYLGGPAPTDLPMSTHLASRTRVGDVFLDGAVPALVLRAAMVVGAGSASFDLLVRAARSSPFVLRPGWMSNRSRPIAVRDVLFHLVRAAGSEPVNAAVDVAGPDEVTYLELVQRCARVAGLPWRVPVPVGQVPAAAAAAVSDLPEPLVRALMESLTHDLVPEAALAPPPGGGTSLDRALREALGCAEPPAMPGPEVPGLLRTVVRERAPVDGAALWRAVSEVGGEKGWPGIPGVFAVRGMVDHLFGGIGLHRGRPERLSAGDAVDSWTVVAVGDRELTLVTDLRMPGRAWLRLSVLPQRSADGAAGECELELSVAFAPDGLRGRLYWYAQKPAHDLVFAAMARGIVRGAGRAALSRSHLVTVLPERHR